MLFKNKKHIKINALQSRYCRSIVLFEDGDVIASIPCDEIKTKKELKRCIKDYCAQR